MVANMPKTLVGPIYLQHVGEGFSAVFAHGVPQIHDKSPKNACEEHVLKLYRSYLATITIM